MYVFKCSPENFRYHFVFCFMASQQLLEIEPQVTFPASYHSMLAEFLNIDRPYFCILNLTICHKFSTELWADDWCLPMHNVNNTSGKCFTRFLFCIKTHYPVVIFNYVQPATQHFKLCANSWNISGAVHCCFNSHQGQELLTEVEKPLLRIKPISFNGDYTANILSLSLSVTDIDTFIIELKAMWVYVFPKTKNAEPHFQRPTLILCIRQSPTLLFLFFSFVYFFFFYQTDITSESFQRYFKHGETQLRARQRFFRLSDWYALVKSRLCWILCQCV